MRRTLLVTNDFPPRVGGIQSYVFEIARRLPADQLFVLTSDHPGASAFDAELPFPVIRHSSAVLLPTPAVAAHAAELIRQHHLTAIWYGAAAPLGLLTRRLRAAGIERTVASAHGHEVGWSMLPGARQMLRRIGTVNDVVTYVSRYARRRISAALGPSAALEALSPGVDTERFRPDPVQRSATRTQLELGAGSVTVCLSRLVARKGQDMLIAVWPEVLARHPDAKLLIVGGGPHEQRLRRQAAASPASDAITLTGSVPFADLPAYYQAGDVFAMPCRTRGGGLDVEGLGIVFLEASACGLPVIAGRSGGAPETVLDGETGLVVDGRNGAELTDAITSLLSDRGRCTRMGVAGQRWVRGQWSWQSSADRLAAFLAGPRSVDRES